MALRAWVGEREAQGKVSLYRGPLLLAYDRRFNTMDPDDCPPGPAADAAGAGELAWAGARAVAPAAPAADGRELVLCDFATAGAAGTPYRTWLPADESWLAAWDGPEVWG